MTPATPVMNDKQRRFLSVLSHALKQLCGKTTNKAARDLLMDGTAYEVEVAIDAKVNGTPLPRQVIGGTLQVNHDEKTTSNENPNPAHVLALALSLMPKTKRRSLLDELPKQFSELGQTLPEVDDDLLHEAEGLLKRLRARKEKTRRGGVSFVQTSD